MFSGNADTLHARRFLVLAAALAMASVVLSALAFEHIGGYIPCKLCLQQREPWYFAIPAGLLAAIGSYVRWPPFIARGLLLICGLVMIYSLVLGVHHAGVEWQWWEGPSDCGAVEGGISQTTGGLLQQLEESIPPSCDDAPLRILGLSFAGWNALASVGLGAVMFWLFATTRNR